MPPLCSAFSSADTGAQQLALASNAGRVRLKRLARNDHRIAEQLLEQSSRVMQRLSNSGIPRAQLAADVLGNAHALDKGDPPATLVLAALRHDGERRGNPERTREIWARVGVLVK
jgi:uncharacterized protein (TIGR02679 family)